MQSQVRWVIVVASQKYMLYPFVVAALSVPDYDSSHFPQLPVGSEVDHGILEHKVQ